ncbi:hypothetical protein GCM10007857_58570 [Bradyrhizobium iriomotense]|uniref:Uncharacterized protein n=1 Tax=Bradyrhizobium iriomotense TaxID=441950 RepID=A0ABQ6B3Z9_9BRAD|nr:hypothetical protein GCM10007857_58570 [Bradyrhizobium iriomotense]
MAGGKGSLVPEIKQRDLLTQQERATNIGRGDGRKVHEMASLRENEPRAFGPLSWSWLAARGGHCFGPTVPVCFSRADLTQPDTAFPVLGLVYIT